VTNFKRLLNIAPIAQPGQINSIFIITYETNQLEQVEVILKETNPEWRIGKTFNERNALVAAKLVIGRIVPNVVAFETDIDKSEIGVEFILMERLKVRF